MKDYTIVRTEHRQGLTVSAIAAKLGKDRKTVRKYLRMDKDQFIRYLERMAERGKAYAAYRKEILKIYEDHEGRTVYASSIHDYLSEKYGELLGSDRTLRNYLTYLKASGAIATGQGREYRPVEPLDYGKQAQIDFGIETTNIGKTWFAAMVLAEPLPLRGSPIPAVYERRRDRPSPEHFDFFGGIPKSSSWIRIRTMIVAENLGDLGHDQGLRRLRSGTGTAAPCLPRRRPGVEGKGRERGQIRQRRAISQPAVSRPSTSCKPACANGFWNAMLSQATRLMLLADFEAHEKPALRPQRASLFRADAASGCRESRKVDQKSLISVAATRYSVPKPQQVKEVEIERRDGLVLVFDARLAPRSPRIAKRPRPV